MFNIQFKTELKPYKGHLTQGLYKIKTLREIITDAVYEALCQEDHNQTRAAKSLDITRNTLRKYMKLHKESKDIRQKAKKIEKEYYTKSLVSRDYL